jgi:hypothetical protein
MLAELRVRSQLLQVIANVTGDLRQKRVDAVADMVGANTSDLSTTAT